jgi:hypothetical protein
MDGKKLSGMEEAMAETYLIFAQEQAREAT